VKRFSWLLGAFAASLLFVASCGDDDSGNTGDAGQDGGGTDGAVDSGGSAKCGDGVAQGDELCDGSDLRSQTCNSATMGAMSGGTLACKSNCRFDVSKCTGEDTDGGEDDGGMGGTGG
jgi:hypothetical protein